MKTVKSGIYQIRHKNSGKVYVGSAINIRERFIRHRYELKHNKHFNQVLQRSWNKYGPEEFEFLILESVENHNDLHGRETYWISELRATERKYGFNHLPSGGGWLGGKHSEESKAKISAGNKGKIISDEVRRAVSATSKLRYAETLGRYKGQMKGKTMSAEARAKISKTRQARMTDDLRQRISEGLQGKPKSQEHRERLRAAMTGKKQSPEHIAARVEKIKETWARKRAAAKAAQS